MLVTSNQIWCNRKILCLDQIRTHTCCHSGDHYTTWFMIYPCPLSMWLLIWEDSADYYTFDDYHIYLMHCPWWLCPIIINYSVMAGPVCIVAGTGLMAGTSGMNEAVTQHANMPGHSFNLRRQSWGVGVIPSAALPVRPYSLHSLWTCNHITIR